MIYATIDFTIRTWASVNVLTLLTEWYGEARYVYTSSSRGEYFQISISPPRNGRDMEKAPDPRRRVNGRQGVAPRQVTCRQTPGEF
jgi:hypothetical protein